MQGVTDRCIHAGHPALTTEMGNGPQCCLLPAAFLRNCSICGCLIHCESKPDPEKGRQCTLLMVLPSSDVPLGSLTEAGPCHACPQCGQLCEVCVGRRALMHTGTIFEGLKISSLANFQQRTIKDLILLQVGLLQQRAVYVVTETRSGLAGCPMTSPQGCASLCLDVWTGLSLRMVLSPPV